MRFINTVSAINYSRENLKSVLEAEVENMHLCLFALETTPLGTRAQYANIEESKTAQTILSHPKSPTS
jgi:hypothetical protein